MPRAALLSIHARVAGTESSTWEDPSLVQLWGPRFNVFVVAARDLATAHYPGADHRPLGRLSRARRRGTSRLAGNIALPGGGAYRNGRADWW